MAIIGNLGNILFVVAKSRVRTFDNLQWNSSAQYATHNRHLKEQLLEFTGVNADKITFTMMLSAFLGADPAVEIERLYSNQKSGKIMRLIIGGKQISKNKWVIQSLNKSFEKFGRKGELLHAKVNVSLLEYPAR